jgi:hypothetical protein
MQKQQSRMSSSLVQHEQIITTGDESWFYVLHQSSTSGQLTGRMVECRQGFPQMQDVLGRLVGVLKRYPAEEVMDMDNIMSRESLDVIGMPHHISICSKHLMHQ